MYYMDLKSSSSLLSKLYKLFAFNICCQKLLFKSTCRQMCTIETKLLLMLIRKPIYLYFRTCSSNNLWVKLGTVMLMKCLQEQKKSVGDEILTICRSLYETKHRLSAEVSLHDQSPCQLDMTKFTWTVNLLIYVISSLNIG